MSLVVAVAYFVTGYLGLMMPASGSSITLIWLPTGIAVAALRRWGYGCWWGVALGAISVNLAIGNPFPFACGIAVGNTLGPLLATRILVRTGFSPKLKRSQDILLLGGASAVGMLVSATVGVICLTVSGLLTDEYLRAWLLWWAGDATGVVAGAPLLFVLNRAELRIILMRRVELVLWGAVIIVVGLGVFVFTSGVKGGLPLILAFLPLPLIVWGAMRFGPIGTSLAIILFSFCAVYGAAIGHGLFARADRLEGVAILWLFMISCGILGWLVSALDASKTQAIESARQLERALEEASLGFLLADADRRITHVSGDFTRLTGYSATEILGRSCRILQGPETDPSMAEKIRSSLRHAGNFEGDILNYRKDGTTFWNALLICPFHDTHGELRGFISIQRDVTQRKTAEAALRDSEERYRQLFESNPQPMWVYDLETLAFLAVNEAAIAKYGYSRGEFMARTIKDIRPSEDVAALLENVAKITRGLDDAGEWRHLLKNGQLIWVRITSHTLTFEGRPAEVVIAQDVTHQRQAEASLRESELRYRTLIETSSDAIFLMALDGRILSANPAAVRLHGYAIEELLAMRMQDLDVPDSAVEFPDRMRRLRNGEPLIFEVAHRRKDGSTFPLEVIASAVEIAGEWFVLAFDRDITDRVKAEELINASLREKESLLKEVHHRVKNNLQIITSLLNLQAETVQDPTILKLLRESQNRVRSMALVHETLYRSGDFGRIDLAAYVDAICNFLSRAYGIDHSRIRIEVHVDDVSLDLDRAIPCGLIINELVSNSLKYAFPENRNGRITVRFTSNSEQNYTLSVADDGVGLPPELELSRLKSLGLQLVNDLVRQLTGSIVIESAPGSGFSICFPAKFPQEQRP